MRRCFLIIFLAIILTSCGWHLRSSREWPRALRVVHLILPDNTPTFNSAFTNLLKSFEVKLTTKKQAPYTLKINSIAFIHNNPNVISASTPTTYNYTYTIKYTIINHKGMAIFDSGVSVSEDLSAEPQQLLTTNAASQHMKDQLQQQAINQLIMQLTMDNVRQALHQ